MLAKAFLIREFDALTLSRKGDSSEMAFESDSIRLTDAHSF